MEKEEINTPDEKGLQWPGSPNNVALCGVPMEKWHPTVPRGEVLLGPLIPAPED